VPVRRSSFEAPSADYDRYNIEVDLGRIGTFGFARAQPSADELLLADLQCNADGHVRHRLGSGRSGYHAGRYLKGIGRTLLAANWSGRDYYHASGHLLASAAAREALISTVLHAAGGGHAINACEAVLARELTELDPGWLTHLRGPRGVSAADLRLQANGQGRPFRAALELPVGAGSLRGRVDMVAGVSARDALRPERATRRAPAGGRHSARDRRGVRCRARSRPSPFCDLPPARHRLGLLSQQLHRRRSVPRSRGAPGVRPAGSRLDPRRGR
jgi:hypothetical protein